MANFIGFDGDCTVGTMDCVQIKTCSATISRVMHDVGGFGQSGRYRRPGKFDIQGSFGGVGKNGSTNPVGLLVAGAPVSITIKLNDGSTDTTLVFDAVLSDVTPVTTHDGEQGITANMQLSSTAVTTNTPFTMTWGTA